jgi:hypothetical protein
VEDDWTTILDLYGGSINSNTNAWGQMCYGQSNPNWQTYAKNVQYKAGSWMKLQFVFDNDWSGYNQNGAYGVGIDNIQFTCN